MRHSALMRLFCLILCYLESIWAINLKDETSSLFKGDNNGLIAAFGDFNADKHTDIFVIGDDGKSVDALISPNDAPYIQFSGPFTRHKLISNIPSSGSISSIVPGDFDGDAQMDLLVTTLLGTERVQMFVYWGNSKAIRIDNYTVIPEHLVDEPLMFDFDADMVPDLLGEITPGQKIVWSTNHSRDFLDYEFAPKAQKQMFRVPHSNAFLDLNNNFNSDLMLSGSDGYEIWNNIEGNWTLNTTEKFPENVKHIGQSSFADINADSQPDHIVPVCEDDACSVSKIWVCSPAQSGVWHEMEVNFKHGEDQWSFINKSSYPVTLHVGDIDLDGYPDLLVTLGTTGDQPKQSVYLLRNQKCSDCKLGRSFAVDWDSPITASTKDSQVTLATFFDFYDDGILDVIVMEKGPTGTKVRGLKNLFDGDACFVKVTVTSGLCLSHCPNGQPPYGVNQPGPSIKYQTIGAEGQLQHSCAAQLSQSAHFALQLPYTVFGLGMSPNFVDKLFVGIPSKTIQKKRVSSWTQIIPNSQLIVIPYPIDMPHRWKNKLFVTPSRLVLITAAVLLGTCGFIGGIVGILYWREKREDKMEKRQDAHKFHFDAM